MKEVLIRPLTTEKSMDLSAQGKYFFKVGKKANKNEIRKAVSDMYKVTVTAVNVSNRKPKTRRYGRTTGLKPGFKVAVVTLKKDQKIELFEEAK